MEAPQTTETESPRGPAGCAVGTCAEEMNWAPGRAACTCVAAAAPAPARAQQCQASPGREWRSRPPPHTHTVGTCEVQPRRWRPCHAQQRGSPGAQQARPGEQTWRETCGVLSVTCTRHENDLHVQGSQSQGAERASPRQGGRDREGRSRLGRETVAGGDGVAVSGAAGVSTARACASGTHTHVSEVTLYEVSSAQKKEAPASLNEGLAAPTPSLGQRRPGVAGWDPVGSPGHPRSGDAMSPTPHLRPGAEGPSLGPVKTFHKSATKTSIIGFNPLIMLITMQSTATIKVLKLNQDKLNSSHYSYYGSG